MKVTKFIPLAALAAIFGAAQFSAQAAVSSPLNFTDLEVTAPQYGGPCSLEELTVRYRILIDITSNFKIESLDAAPSVVTATAAATGTFTGPGSIGGATPPLNSNNNYNLDTYDGVTDFGGLSGVQDALGASSDSGWITVSAADEALFVGAGTVSFLFSEAALSSVSGPGNIVSQINTTGNVSVEVEYICRAVPETGTMAAAAGMASLVAGAAIRRFRAVKA